MMGVIAVGALCGLVFGVVSTGFQRNLVVFAFVGAAGGLIGAFIGNALFADLCEGGAMVYGGFGAVAIVETVLNRQMGR